MKLQDDYTKLEKKYKEKGENKVSMQRERGMKQSLNYQKNLILSMGRFLIRK